MGGREGGRQEAMMICRERASVEEGRVEGGRVDEGNERGRDGTRHGRRDGKRGGRKRVEEGLREEVREHGSTGEGNFKGGSIIHKPTINKPALALETLVLQMTNSEHVYIINSVLRCVRMYCLTC